MGILREGIAFVKHWKRHVVHFEPIRHGTYAATSNFFVLLSNVVRDDDNMPTHP